MCGTAEVSTSETLISTVIFFSITFYITLLYGRHLTTQQIPKASSREKTLGQNHTHVYVV